MPCAECGELLDDSSVRPARLQPRPLARVGGAALLASAASLGLALLPIVAAGTALVLPVEPSRLVVVSVVSVAVVATIVAQTLAGLWLAGTAPAGPARSRLVAVVIIRAPLLLLVMLGALMYLVTQALKFEYPGGDYTGAATLSGGALYWLARTLPQVAVVVPVVVLELRLARSTERVVRGVSDERAAWRILNGALVVSSCLIVLAGLLTIVPFAGWVFGPSLLLVCNSVLFGSIAVAAVLHMSELGNRRKTTFSS